MATQADKRSQAAALLASGMAPKTVAERCNIGVSTLRRWRKQYPAEFTRHEPGSPEHRRHILLDALEHGSLSEQLRAVELLDRLGENKRGAGSGRIVVYIGEKPLEGTDYIDATPVEIEPVASEATSDPSATRSSGS